MHARHVFALLTLALALGTGCTYDFDQFREQGGSTTPTQDVSGDSGASDTGPRDVGADARVTPDSGGDGGPADAARADGGPADATAPDAADATADASEDMSVEEDMGVVPDPALCGNDVIDPGELCDPCPVCDDMDACTMDSSQGSASTCDQVCSFSQPQAQCISGDGCCPVSCTLADDADCTPDCRLDHTWPQNLKGLEAQLFALLNQGRAQARSCDGATLSGPQPAFTLDPALVIAARCQAEDMAKRNYVSATTPEGDQVDFWVDPTGYDWASLASHVSSAATPQAMVDSWFASPRICARMMDPSYTEAGVGWATAPGTTGGLPRGAHVAAQPR